MLMPMPFLLSDMPFRRRIAFTPFSSLYIRFHSHCVIATPLSRHSMPADYRHAFLRHFAASLHSRDGFAVTLFFVFSVMLFSQRHSYFRHFSPRMFSSLPYFRFHAFRYYYFHDDTVR